MMHTLRELHARVEAGTVEKIPNIFFQVVPLC
jgi:hypothetical protein